VQNGGAIDFSSPAKVPVWEAKNKWGQSCLKEAREVAKMEPMETDAKGKDVTKRQRHLCLFLIERQAAMLEFTREQAQSAAARKKQQAVGKRTLPLPNFQVGFVPPLFAPRVESPSVVIRYCAGSDDDAETEKATEEVRGWLLRKDHNESCIYERKLSSGSVTPGKVPVSEEEMSAEEWNLWDEAQQYEAAALGLEWQPTHPVRVDIYTKGIGAPIGSVGYDQLKALACLENPAEKKQKRLRGDFAMLIAEPQWETLRVPFYPVHERTKDKDRHEHAIVRQRYQWTWLHYRRLMMEALALKPTSLAHAVAITVCKFAHRQREAVFAEMEKLPDKINLDRNGFCNVNPIVTKDLALMHALHYACFDGDLTLVEQMLKLLQERGNTQLKEGMMLFECKKAALLMQTRLSPQVLETLAAIPTGSASYSKSGDDERAQHWVAGWRADMRIDGDARFLRPAARRIQSVDGTGQIRPGLFRYKEVLELLTKYIKQLKKTEPELAAEYYGSRGCCK